MGKGITVSLRGGSRNEVMSLLDDIERELTAIAEQCVNEARSYNKDNDWHDVTGNLRSSIAASVVRDGETVATIAPETFSGTQGNGSAGAAAAHAALAQAQNAVSARLTLHLVAAMDYASNVEARGRNVLASAILKGERLISEMITRLRR